MNIYAGIGSRKTPKDVCNRMTQMARYLDETGWTLRSGHADGADQAFELGSRRKEIYLPWEGFNGGRHRQNGCIVPVFSSQMEKLARAMHPAWERCSQGDRKLHMRNVCQVLGEDCSSPCDMVICWTEGGRGGGGTGMAIRIATIFGIPVFDLALGPSWDQLEAFVREHERKTTGVTT